MAYCGFSVHGVEGLFSEASLPSGEAQFDTIADVAFEEARLTSAAGGNCLRVFYTPRAICAPFSDMPLELDMLPRTHAGAWHLLERNEKLRHVNTISAWVWRIADIVRSHGPRGDGLNFAQLDAYLAGISRFNRQAPAVERVRVLLTAVMFPPRQIIELPEETELAHFGITFRFPDIYGLYCQVCADIARYLVERYVSPPGEDPLVVAFELCNEPDYEWLPDELRMEKAEDRDSSRLTKYITELHGAAIPETARPLPAERAPWGGFREQTGPWRVRPALAAGVLEFDWGEKFDWYLHCYGTFATHVSFALRQAADRVGSPVDILSGGVTHNNVDYLIRLHQQVPAAFEFCTALAVHPYHWPDYDIHDTRFVGRREFADWRAATPRRFAQKYFKCFDFFRVLADLTGPRTPYAGFRGKPLWLSEFGLGTKLMGRYNEPGWEHVPFIRPRRMPADALPRQSAVWEDIWDAFLAAVTPDELRSLGVVGMFFYSLRETRVQGLDKHDDDRTNFAILRRDGSPRMERETFDRLRQFIHGMTGRLADAEIAFNLTPDWSRTQEYSLLLLRSEPWAHFLAPGAVFDGLTMLTDQERRFLYWLTKRYYSGAGAIVDAGCFAGGSTLALGTGLAENWPEPQFWIDSYDLFLADGYMVQWYFKDRAHEDHSFRDIFDEQTGSVASKVRVHHGDITTFGWDGRPVEILFLDVCKTWEVNDYCMRTFFPLLIPGQSIVVQQDYFHQAEEWLIASMELLWDKFDYVAYVPLNTAVFRLRTAITAEDLPTSMRSLGLERLAALIRRQVDRHDDPFQKGMILTALAKLYVEFDDRECALAVAQTALDVSSRQQWVVEGLRLTGLLT